MPKKYRLSRAEFLQLPRTGRRVHGTYFSLTETPLAIGGGVKAACVVSKKVSARSVDRNRIERHCRECLRPLLSRIQKSVALILYAKREAAAASPADIRRDIQKLLERIG